MIKRLFAATCFLAFTVLAQAQDFPTRAIRIVVPFPAGGSADLIPRIVGEKLSTKWSQPVIVENRAGAAGNIGAEIVYKSEPDGYTLLSAPPPPLVINQSLYTRLAFDPTQFVPVSVMAAIPNVLLINPGVGAGSVQELITFAKAAPDRLNYASQGSGSTSHLTAEMFKSMAGGLRITHIPYKGTAPALTDLLGGQVDIMFDNLGVSLQHVKSGKLKALAVCSETRIPALPDVPAMSEFLPGFVAIAWFGVVAPPKTPMPIAEKISAAVAEVLKLSDVQKRLADLSAEPIGNTPQQMAVFMKKEVERWREVIRSAGVRAD
ncbi:MAG TPA: tripartite tricarboxylate transporter substrate binding protein [Burkholderiales bacterium]